MSNGSDRGRDKDKDKDKVDDTDIRWKQRFANYEKALAQLRKFIEKGHLSELEQQGLIKAFEYTYELAWKTLKDFLEYQGQSEIYGSRDTFRRSFEVGLIERGNDWMDMLESRNRTSHTYNQETAEEIAQAIQSTYFDLFTSLSTKLQTLL